MILDLVVIATTCLNTILPTLGLYVIIYIHKQNNTFGFLFHILEEFGKFRIWVRYIFEQEKCHHKDAIDQNIAKMKRHPLNITTKHK